MTGHRIKIPRGYKINKDGKLVRSNTHKDVGARIRDRKSKKVTVKRK